MNIVSLIVNWNGAKIISDTLDSLLKVDHTGHTLEIVVVDNASTDGSVELIATKYPSVKLLRNPTNMGFAAGNNRGIRYALRRKADYVWLINSDIIVASDSLTKFIEGAHKYPRAGILGCKIYFAPGYEFYKDRYTPTEIGKVIWYAGGIIDWKNVLGSHRGVDLVDKGQFDYDLETDFVTGAIMFIRADVLERLKGFDPKYCFYFEENDLCQRAAALGSKLMFLAQPKAWHKNAQSTGMSSPLQDYFITRNRLLFGMRFAPYRSKIALLREAQRLRKTGRPWQQTAISDFLHGRFGAGSYQLQ